MERGEIPGRIGEAVAAMGTETISRWNMSGAGAGIVREGDWEKTLIGWMDPVRVNLIQVKMILRIQRSTPYKKLQIIQIANTNT